MDGFSYVLPVTVRWRDLDAFGHVNNAVFASYLEMARAGFWHDHLSCRTPQDIPFVIARLEIDFRHPVALFDEVRVGLRPTHIGRTSFDFEYAVAGGGRVAATAMTRQVCVRHETGRPVRVPPDLAETLERFVR